MMKKLSYKYYNKRITTRDNGNSVKVVDKVDYLEKNGQLSKWHTEI